jgi:NAD(P)-dependent dehydrogenase (short-subunit alcohol dehydrogenase family)
VVIGMAANVTTQGSPDRAPQVAIVTGGGSGIGEGLSRELARSGSMVIVADIRDADAQQVATGIIADGGLAEARRVDVSQESDVQRLVAETTERYGRLDYLFNNAGIAIGGDARDLTSQHWRQVMDVDVYGVLHGCLAAYPVMVRQGFGHIVNTSSAAAFFPDPGNGPYCTAKHALIGLSLSLRLEGADLGVRVSVVCPGLVRSNIYDHAGVVNMPALAALAGRDREQAVGVPERRMAADRAARVILDGVARNEAVIVFPANVRWARRLYALSPGSIERLMLRRWHTLRSYRASASA